MESFHVNQTLLFLILNVLLKHFDCVIYNEMTGRCIQMTSLRKGSSEVGVGRNMSVYAFPCSWENKMDLTSHDSMSDEWVEIVPIVIPPNFVMLDDRNLAAPIYSIRKVTMDTEVCINSKHGQPVTSLSCDFQNQLSHFTIHKQALENARMQNGIKIKDFMGLCLTAQPGRESLIFKECTRRHSFLQTWLVCRHNKICDVEVTWTPRGIVFPNTTETENKLSSYDKLIDNVDNSLSPDKLMPCQAQAGYQNEVLYSLQNGLKIYGGAADFLVSSVALFYPKSSLYEAQNLSMELCQNERLNCGPCISIVKGGQINEFIVAEWLVSWMQQCNKISKLEFFSKDVLHVPRHFFPHYELLSRDYVTSIDKYKVLISTLKNYLALVEGKVKEEEDKIEMSLTAQDYNETHPVLDLDIRFNSNKNGDNKAKIRP